MKRRFLRVSIVERNLWSIGYCFGKTDSFVMVEVRTGLKTPVDIATLWFYSKGKEPNWLYSTDIPTNLREGKALNGYLWGLATEALRSI